MATPTNHWKLGLFIVVGVSLVLGALLIFGASNFTSDLVTYTTYYDETVQGLEVGSPVKFRGVTVGSVSKIGVAPDRRHVAVSAALESAQIGNLGLAGNDPVSAGLRVQLAAQGITGVKFLQIDFFDVAHYPPPELPFPPAEHYLPAAESTLKSVEDSVVASVDRMPAIAASVEKTSERLVQVLERTDRILVLVERELTGLDLRGLSAQARKTLANLDRAIEGIDGVKGLVASLTRSADAYGELAAGEVGGELPETLRSIRQATTAIARLAEALEVDSDMLIKGRSKSK